MTAAALQPSVDGVPRARAQYVDAAAPDFPHSIIPLADPDLFIAVREQPGLSLDVKSDRWKSWFSIAWKDRAEIKTIPSGHHSPRLR